MNLDIRRRPVQFERFVGESSLKAVVEGTLALPVGAPPMHRVVRVTGVPRVGQAEATDGEVMLEGTVDVSVLYATAADGDDWAGMSDPDDDDGDLLDEDVAFGGVEGLHRAVWKRELPFHGIVELQGAHEGVDVLAKVEVDEIRAGISSDGRALHVDLVLAASVRGVTLERADVPELRSNLEEEPGSPLRKESVEVETHDLRLRHEASLQGRLYLASDAPPMERPVDIGVAVREAEVTFGDGWARVDGTLGVHAAYVPSVETEQPVEFFAWDEAQWTFSHRFEDERIQGDHTGHVQARPLAAEAEIIDDGRGIDVFADLELTLEVGGVKELTIVTDGSSGSEDTAVETRSESFSIQVVAGRGEQESVISGSVELPEGVPPIERLLAHEVRGHVDEALVLGDRVSVAGHVDVSLIYVGRGLGMEEPVYAVEWKGAIPLNIDIPVDGVHPPMHAHVDIDVVDLDPDLLNREAIEWNGKVRAAAVVQEQREVEAVVEAVTIGPEDPDPPTYTFLVVDEGDSLWKVSRRYRVSPEAILAANPDLESLESSLAPGRKLLIPRHRREDLVPVQAPAPAPALEPPLNGAAS